MRVSLLSLLRCPKCRAQHLTLEAGEENTLEVRSGAVLCAACGERYGVQAGILDLLYQPKETILREQRGWEQLMGTPDATPDAELRLLPYHPDPMWQRIARDFDAVLERVDLRDKRVLDIGSGRGWSARHLALRGAEVVATDILRARGVGLETADLYLDQGCYFERVLCDMEDLPFADASFDYVLSTAALHHALDLAGVFGEVRRVLRDDGGVMLTNEPVLRRGEAHSWEHNPEVEAGINEHVYTIDEWLAALHAAGFAPTLVFPESMAQAWREGQLASVVPGHLSAEFVRRLLEQPDRSWMDDTASLARIYRCYSLPLTLIARRSGDAPPPAPLDGGDLFLGIATGIAAQAAPAPDSGGAQLRAQLREREAEVAALRRLVAGYENGRVMRIMKWLQQRGPRNSP
jgi:SAM-dependent methyltransferase